LSAPRKLIPRIDSPNLLPLADVLAELDVPRSTFFRWKATGQAPRTIKYPNGSLRIRRADLDAWINAHEEGVAA
jgi:predicted DNA-binding transcriptional regulator AlpA